MRNSKPCLKERSFGKLQKGSELQMEFKGEYSKKCRRYIFRRHALRESCIMILPIVLAYLPFCLVISLVWPGQWYEIGVVLIALGLFLLFSPAIPFTKEMRDAVYPTRIVIPKNGRIISKGKNFSHDYSVDDIYDVIDCGEWYHIRVGLMKDDAHFVCEKRLMTKGTIEDFEKEFDGLIVRK